MNFDFKDPRIYKNLLNMMGYDSSIHNFAINKAMEDSGFNQILNFSRGLDQRLQKVPRNPVPPKAPPTESLMMQRVDRRLAEPVQNPEAPVYEDPKHLYNIHKMAKQIKEAGGPGSNNSSPTKLITKEYKGIALSPIMSIGKRKAYMEEHPYSEQTIAVPNIRYVCQEKFLPSKLTKFKKEPKLLDIPLDILKDKKGDYHVMDGHHRFLAALNTGKKKLKAKVYIFKGPIMEKKSALTTLALEKRAAMNKEAIGGLARGLVHGRNMLRGMGAGAKQLGSATYNQMGKGISNMMGGFNAGGMQGAGQFAKGLGQASVPGLAAYGAGNMMFGGQPKPQGLQQYLPSRMY